MGPVSPRPDDAQEAQLVDVLGRQAREGRSFPQSQVVPHGPTRANPITGPSPGRQHGLAITPRWQYIPGMSTRQKIALGVGALLLGVTWSCHRAPARTAEQMHWDSVAAGPRWAQVLADSGGFEAIDLESVVRFDSLRYRAWWKIATPRDTVVTLGEFACGTRRMRLVSGSEPFAAGNSAIDSSWIEVPPEGAVESLFRAVCGYGASRNLPIVKP